MSLQIVQNQQLKPIGDKVAIDTQLSTTSENAISNKAVTEEFKKSGAIVLHRHTPDLQDGFIIGEWKLYPERNQCYVRMDFGSYNVNFDIDNDYLEFVGLTNVVFVSYLGISHLYTSGNMYQWGMNGNAIDSQVSGTSSALKLNFILDVAVESIAYYNVSFNGSFVLSQS